MIRTSRTATIKYGLKNGQIKPQIISRARQNLRAVIDILLWNQVNGIGIFRIGSRILPLINNFDNGSYRYNFKKIFAPELLKIRQIVSQSNTALSMHVTKFTNISSPNEKVFNRSLNDLKYCAQFLDSILLNKRKGYIIMHMGGLYNSRDETISRFVKRYQNLSPAIKKYLAIENTERHWPISVCLDINRLCGCPVVYDLFHEQCYSRLVDLPMPDHKKNIIAAAKTWLWRSPKYHISSQKVGFKIGAHGAKVEMPLALQKCGLNRIVMYESSNREKDVLRDIRCGLV